MKIHHISVIALAAFAAGSVAMKAVSDDSMFAAPNRSISTPAPIRSFLAVPNHAGASSFRISPPALRSDIDVRGTTFLGDDSR